MVPGISDLFFVIPKLVKKASIKEAQLTESDLLDALKEQAELNYKYDMFKQRERLSDRALIVFKQTEESLRRINQELIDTFEGTLSKWHSVHSDPAEWYDYIFENE